MDDEMKDHVWAKEDDDNLVSIYHLEVNWKPGQIVNNQFKKKKFWYQDSVSRELGYPRVENVLFGVERLEVVENGLVPFVTGDGEGQIIRNEMWVTKVRKL